MYTNIIHNKRSISFSQVDSLMTLQKVMSCVFFHSKFGIYNIKLFVCWYCKNTYNKGLS